MTPEEFFARADCSGPDCWLWKGAIKSNGYGNLAMDGRTVSAHKAAWILTNGPVPKGLCVLHWCDVRPCVRPDHLHLGTKRRNSQEMIARSRYGGQVRLSPQDRLRVAAECASGRSQHDVARQFGVSQTTVSNIVRGKHMGQFDAADTRYKEVPT